MMWNFLTSCLLTDAAIVLYDGNPGHPDMSSLWQLAADAEVTCFGTSASYISACMKTGIEPGDEPHHTDSRLLVARHDRTLDRSGTAPARQERRVDVQHRQVGEQRLFDQLAEGTDRGPLTAGREDPLPRLGQVDVTTLEDFDAQLLGGGRHRRRAHLASAALLAVGKGHRKGGAVA